MIKDFEQKFKLLEKFEKKLPGISTGLNFLNILELKNQDLEQISANKKDCVKFFDSKNIKFKYYDFYKFNDNLTQLYEQDIILRNLIIYNKLYLIMTNNFTSYFAEYNYSFDRNLYNCYSIINKIFHNLRLSYEKKLDSFFMENILINFNTKYFGPDVSKEEFYNFILGFFSVLESLGVVVFSEDNNYVKFNKIYQIDLLKAMFFSFDLMLLGDNDIYDVLKTDFLITEEKLQSMCDIYEKADEKIKAYIDDVSKCLVIVSVVDSINIYPDMNNLLIELISNDFKIKI